MIKYVFIRIHIEFGDILKWYISWTTYSNVITKIVHKQNMSASFPFLLPWLHLMSFFLAYHIHIHICIVLFCWFIIIKSSISNTGEIVCTYPSGKLWHKRTRIHLHWWTGLSMRFLAFFCRTRSPVLRPFSSCPYLLSSFHNHIIVLTICNISDHAFSLQCQYFSILAPCSLMWMWTLQFRSFFWYHSRILHQRWIDFPINSGKCFITWHIYI